MNYNQRLKQDFNDLSPSFQISICTPKTQTDWVYGYRMIKPSKLLVNEKTQYDIASLTKTFTSFLIFKSIEIGKITLDTKVTTIESNFSDLDNITILDLLNHRQNIWTNGYLGNCKTKEEFYQILYTAYVKDKYRTYVDVHYIILGVLLEKIYHKSYKDLIETMIIFPMNLTETGFYPSDNVASNNYEWIDDSFHDEIKPGMIHDTKARVAKYYGVFTGHASLFSTSKNILTFLQNMFFFENGFFKQETIDLMLSHDDINQYNYNLMKPYTKKITLNEMYQDCISLISDKVTFAYNYCGVRFRSPILDKNDVPISASDHTIFFLDIPDAIF